MGRDDAASTLKVGNRDDSRTGMCWGSSYIISPRNSNQSQVTWLHGQLLVILCVSRKMCGVFPRCSSTSFLKLQTRPKYSHESLHHTGKVREDDPYVCNKFNVLFSYRPIKNPAGFLGCDVCGVYLICFTYSCYTLKCPPATFSQEWCNLTWWKTISTLWVCLCSTYKVAQKK